MPQSINAAPRRSIAPEPELTWSGELVDPALEAEFRVYRYDRELKAVLRWSAWSATLIYVLFGPVDLLVVYDQFELAATIRYGFVVPLSIALAVLSMTRYAASTHRMIGVLHSLIGPALFLTVGELAVDPGGLLYTIWGAVLFPLLVPQLTRIGVKYTAVITGVVLSYLILLDIFVSPRILWEELFIILFFITGCGYGLWATYSQELAA